MGWLIVLAACFLVLAALGFLGTLALFNANAYDAEPRWKDKYHNLLQLQRQGCPAVLPMVVVQPSQPLPSLQALAQQGITLPIAAKPNYGTAKGIGFMPLRSEEEYRAFAAVFPRFPHDYLLQPFLGHYEVEIRIAGHRYSSTKAFLFDPVVVMKSAVYNATTHWKDPSRPAGFQSKHLPPGAVTSVAFPPALKAEFSRTLAAAYPQLRFFSIDAMAPSVEAFTQQHQFKILEVNGGLGFSRMPHKYPAGGRRLACQLQEGIKFWARRVGHGLKHTLQRPVQALRVFRRSIQQEKDTKRIAARYDVLQQEMERHRFGTAT